jgi:hypothetical protein
MAKPGSDSCERSPIRALVQSEPSIGDEHMLSRWHMVPIFFPHRALLVSTDVACTSFICTLACLSCSSLVAKFDYLPCNQPWLAQVTGVLAAAESYMTPP